MNGFIVCDIQSFFFNTKKLLEAETKLIYIVHLKAFLFQLHNVLLIKYVYIYRVIHKSVKHVRKLIDATAE